MAAEKSQNILFALFVVMVSATAVESSADNRNALRHIVQDQCVANWLEHNDSKPCERVYLPTTKDQSQGYALLADRKGGAHFLLIPTKAVTGIEAADLLLPGTPNYFAAAWEAQQSIHGARNFRVRRDGIGLAVNSKYSRSQDQLHIHIECINPEVYALLHAQQVDIGERWSTVVIHGSIYEARRIPGEQLEQVNPFQLLADHLSQTNNAMEAYTLVIAGIEFKEGPGFILLTGKSVPGGETLLDPSCAVANQTEVRMQQ